MERLVIEYTVLADCGGDSFTVNEPISYSNKEEFVRDFINKLRADGPTIKLGGNILYTGHFKHKNQLLPFKVYTLDEWFEKVEKVNADTQLSQNSLV